MATKRTGVFVGAFVPSTVKKALRTMANGKHWTLTKLVVRIFEYAIKHPEIIEEEKKQ
jgi:hypothetical protein